MQIVKNTTILYEPYYGSSYNIVDHTEAHIIFYPKAQIKKCTASRKALKKSLA